MKTLNWERARVDVRPFLERERDIDLLTRETLGSLLGGRETPPGKKQRRP
jgi:hypothetical protein